MPETLTPAEELLALRTSNAELLKKSRDRKAKVTEHEATITDLQTRLTTAETALHDATVGAPLRSMAAALSPIPDVWLAEFAKHYKVELKDGKLALLTLDGKPVMDGESEVPMDATAISKLLTAGNNEDLASFTHIMYGSKATGGGASPAPGSQVQYPDRQQDRQGAKPQFGLR
jgi:hypothetical protein